MTPKEKAEELYYKHFSMITIESPIDRVSSIPYVKKCALIAVDEVIFALSYHSDTEISEAYWQEVIQEIEAL